MADRAVNDGESNVSREVFQLDNDERWQARLDEARARREVALAEKAAGKTSKKRLKPWEVDGSAGAKPIEPIIQEKEDDRLDFADRVDTIRAVSKPAPQKVGAEFPRNHNFAAKATPPIVVRPPRPELVVEEPAFIPAKTPPAAYKPPAPDEFDQILTALPLPKEARLDVSLVLPDAPDVNDIAARYAATLKPEITPEPVLEEVVEPEVVAAPITRRRRPELLLVAVSALALLPFATQVPPLSIGPDMPRISGFAFQPALGVTWSMQEVPVATKSGEWVPRRSLAPAGPTAVAEGTPADYASAVAPLGAPSAEIDAGAVPWTPMPLVALGQSTKLFQPSLTGSINPGFTDEPSGPLLAPTETVQRGLPEFGNAPAKPRPPSIKLVEPDAAPDEASVTTPPETAPLSPLKITILSPSQSDKKVAVDIAQDLPRRGHEVVRVQEVGYSIKSRNLRFFHEEDRQEAARIAKAYDAELRDFTWYRPKPTEGTTELWLTGRGASPNPVRQARRVQRSSPALEPPAPQRVMPAPTIQSIERKRSLFGGLFQGHKPQGGRPNTSEGGGSTRTASTGNSTDTGDTGSGGVDTGVIDTSGTDIGGIDTGGTDTGGIDTGGVDTGDTDTGGIGTGGTDTGGTDAGGTDTGGTDTGGTDTGGTDTGGTDTGGTDTGGSSSPGASGSSSSGGGSSNSGSSSGDSDSGDTDAGDL